MAPNGQTAALVAFGAGPRCGRLSCRRVNPAEEGLHDLAVADWLFGHREVRAVGEDDVLGTGYPSSGPPHPLRSRW